MNSNKYDQDRDSNLLFLDGHFWLVLFVSITSIYGIALLSATVFDPLPLLALAIITCLLVSKYADIRYSTIVPDWKIGFVITLIIAAVLRSDVYPHMMGGQDQGLYTNYAEIMLKTGALNFVDSFRATLPASLREIYDNTKMASVPLIDADSSLRTISFYPLHPMWMAVFGSVFGLEYKTLSLLLFSLIYIWSGKLLAQEIFASERAGNIAALLLSINPVLVFFSKYPVTEIVGLAFSLSGYLYLIRGVKEPAFKTKISYISLSLLCFTAFFFVRFQFLMYLPFFGILIFGLLLHNRRHHWQSGAIPALILIIVLFMVSLIWYYVFQREMFISMFGEHFKSLIDQRMVILAVILVSFLFLLSAYQFRLGANQHYAATGPVLWFVSKSGMWLLLSIMVSAVSIVRLYESGSLTPFPWALNTDDPFLFRYHALYRYVLFISPFAFLALIYGSFDKNFKAGLPSLLLLFIATTLLVTLIQPAIPYLFYYGRYLAGEMLPYSIIAVGGIVSIWLGQNKRLLAYGVLLLTIVYYSAFLVPQFRFVESEPLHGFDDLSSKIHRNDIVLAVGLDDRILVPLRLSYDKKIFKIKEWDSSERFITKDIPELRSIALGQAGRLILLVHSEEYLRMGSYLGGATFENSFLTNGEHVRADVIQSPQPLQALMLPFKRVSKSDRWLFYDTTSVDFSDLPRGGICPDNLDFSSSGNLKMSGVQLTNFSHQEKNGRWTVGDYAEIQCHLKTGRSYSALKLSVTPYLPASNKLHKISERRVSVSINGADRIERALSNDNNYETISIPINSKDTGLLRVGLKMHELISPFDVGESQDSRKLGLHVRSLSLE